MNRDLHKKYWINELRGYGIHAGPNGERLEDMEYYALRGYLVKMQMQRDLEPMHSRWF